MSGSFRDVEVFLEAGSRYEVVSGVHVSPIGDAAVRLAEHEARWVLESILTSGRATDVVRAYRSVLDGPLALAHEADVLQMRDALLVAAARGEIVVFETPLRGGVREREESDESPSAPPIAPREEKTWIGIALFDRADPPAPVPFARYKLSLPDGSTQEGILDANGRARVDGIDPGTCQVSFPSFHDADWS